MRTLILALALVLTGCATGTDLQDSAALLGIIKQDLAAAKANFDAAGMPTEAACVQSVLDRMAVEEAQQMQVRGLVSLGSAAYIAYARVAGSQQRPIPDTCYAIIGKITTAVGKQGVKAVAPF